MRKWSRSVGDRRGEMGVGTLIIFIAMVLVAAVAASVLINVVDKLQNQATEVADDVQTSLSTQLTIKNINSEDVNGDGTYDRLVIAVRVTGSTSVDTTGIMVILNNRDLYFNSYLEELDQVTEDETLNRYFYDFHWHNPSGLNYVDGDRYLEPGQTGIIIIGGDNVGFEQVNGDWITIKIIPIENSLFEPELRHKVGSN